MILVPKNWAKHQHYKDRLPPWIKLHRDLLTDRDYMTLPTASKALAPLMWLLASESKDGRFTATLEELQFRLHISKQDYDEGIKPLINKGFFIVASKMLADCKQVAIPETETERETETEIAKAIRPRQAGTPSAPIDEIISLYNEKLPMLSRVTVINDSRRRAISARWREVVTTDKLDKEKGLEFFSWFFEMVSKSKFLTGRSKDWKADLDFLFNPSKFPRIIEGAYHKE